MTKIEDFRELSFLKELNDALASLEKTLEESYSMDEGSTEDIWEQNNTVEVESVPYIFRNLQTDILPTNLTLHYTQMNNEDSYESNGSRFILMDGLKPIHLIWFDEVIDSEKGCYEGLKKEGIEKIIRAALRYHHFEETSFSS